MELPHIHTANSWETAFDDKGFSDHFTNTILPDYLHQCRWFAAKNVRIKRYSISNLLNYHYFDKKAYLLVVEVVLITASTENYLLPLVFSDTETEQPIGTICSASLGNESGFLCDAVFNESFRNSLFHHLMHQGDVANNQGWYEFKKGEILQPTVEITSRLLNAEQSNTTIVYNDNYYLKLYRKLFRDSNPDFELSSFLTEQAKFKNSPMFAGSITWKRENFYDVSLALMQQKVDNDGDAWNYFLGQANSYFSRIESTKTDISTIPKVPLYKPLKAKELPQILVDLISEKTLQDVVQLAKRTAEMHIALFSDKSNRSFAPVNFGGDYQVWLLNRLMYQFDNRFNLLEMNYHKLQGKAKEFADKFISSNEAIKNRMLNFDDQKLNSKRIRIHGDYHLGQILKQGDDFIILDFEGEPESTIRDRKVKQPPIKDVAGLFRSFHYAVFATIFNNSHYSIPSEQLEEAGGRYYRAVVAVFLDTYLTTAFDNGLDIGYAKEIDYLLRYHIFEKAIYELGYELNSRPDWVIIPLKGIMQILNNE